MLSDESCLLYRVVEGKCMKTLSATNVDHLTYDDDDNDNNNDDQSINQSLCFFVSHILALAYLHVIIQLVYAVCGNACLTSQCIDRLTPQ
jgi:hypothetical protein